MMITNAITVDLSKPSALPLVYGVQGDCYTRVVEVSLVHGGTAWAIPSDVSASVSYTREDGTGGTYAALPSGEPACSISGYVLQVFLAPQVLQLPGIVRLQITLTQGHQQLSTFPFRLHVIAGEAHEGEDEVPANDTGLTLWDAEGKKHYRIWVSNGNLLMEALS